MHRVFNVIFKEVVFLQNVFRKVNFAVKKNGYKFPSFNEKLLFLCSFLTNQVTYPVYIECFAIGLLLLLRFLGIHPIIRTFPLPPSAFFFWFGTFFLLLIDVFYFDFLDCVAFLTLKMRILIINSSEKNLRFSATLTIRCARLCWRL